MTILEVTLSRVLTGEGLMAVKVKTPDPYNAVEVLGLLEAAKLRIFRDMEVW